MEEEGKSSKQKKCEMDLAKCIVCQKDDQKKKVGANCIITSVVCCVCAM